MIDFIIFFSNVCCIRAVSQGPNKLLFDIGSNQHLDESSEKLFRISELGREKEQTAFPEKKKKNNTNRFLFSAGQNLFFH